MTSPAGPPQPCPLLDPRVFTRQWRLSPLPAGVSIATFVATTAFAPRSERGVGVGLAGAVRLWRELRVDVPADGPRRHTDIAARPALPRAAAAQVRPADASAGTAVGPRALRCDLVTGARR